MTAAAIYKIALLIVFIMVLISLFSGMTFLLKDQGKTNRTVISLTIRVILSICLFLMLIIGYFTGLLQPHGIIPKPPVEQTPP